MTFVNFVNENNLTQLIENPTRNENILDLCISSNPNMIKNVLVHSTFSTSDHCFFSCEVNIGYVKKLRPNISYDFKRSNWDMIHLHLSLVNWHQMMQNGNVYQMWNRFKNLLEFLVFTYVPVRVICARNIAPWLNQHIKKITKKKRILWHRYKLNPTVERKQIYNNHCKYVKKEVLKAKCAYEKNKFLGKNQSPKVFYSYIDQNLNNKTSIPMLKVNNIEINDSVGKSEALLRQYESVYTNDNGVFPICEQKMLPDSLVDVHITDNDIIYALNQMRGSNASGLDGLHPILIKNIRCHIIYPLKLIFTKSMQTGLIPDDWKNAIIIPVYKNNKRPSEVVSYRPICLTSIISKLFERIIHKNMLSYIISNNLISQRQHGFLARRSTATNLMSCLNNWTKMIDKKENIDVVYVDLAKAFDSVCHSKLIYKLRKLGFGGNLLHWLKIFLTDRKHYVKVDDTISSESCVESGIPQGTILGPLLFNLYIDEVSNQVENSEIQLYADDAKVYGKVNSEQDVNYIHRDIERMELFFSDWQLTINPEKCELLHVGNNNSESPYTICGNPIASKTFCKDLGIFVSEDLSVRKHCANIVRTAYIKIKQFNLSFVCKDINFKLFIYKTYIRPLLESNTQLWSPHLLQDIDMVERVQRRFTKYLPGMRDRSYLDRLLLLELESLESRRIFFDLLLLYKIIHNHVDIPYDNLFQFSSNSTRGHRYKIQIQYSRVSCRKYFFINRIATIWNALPAIVAESETIVSFKSLLEKYNLNIYCRGRAHMA